MAHLMSDSYMNATLALSAAEGALGEARYALRMTERYMDRMPPPVRTDMLKAHDDRILQLQQSVKRIKLALDSTG